MKVLVIGSGGREHAICWKLSQSEMVETVICLPGNPGIGLEEKCHCHEETLDYKSVEGRRRALEIARSYDVSFTVIGPEEPLVYGIVDDFRKAGLKVLGPDSRAAQLEGSKAFAKEFMSEYGIRTPLSQLHTDYEKAAEKIKDCDAFPLVIKADGLAGGKGVYICASKKEALDALDELMKTKKFGESGREVLIEEFIEGEEISVLALVDGKAIRPLLSSKDHKKLLDADKGPNTGGMGAIAPSPIMNDILNQDFVESCLNPTLEGIINRGFDYRGIIFFGLMVRRDKCYLLEYNVRMGDPETQSVLPLLESDLMRLFLETEESRLEGTPIKWKKDACVNISVASKGYPYAYEKGKIIKGYDDPKLEEDIKLFFAGVSTDSDATIISSGGRVLSLSAIDKDLSLARTKAYEAIKNIHFDGMYYRKDIGQV